MAHPMSEIETERRIATLEAGHANIDAWLKRIDGKVELLLQRENERRGASHAVKVLWGIAITALSVGTTLFTTWLRTRGG